MRVITGKYKGMRFEIPRNFKARPTTDFAKENLFNVLRAYLDFENTKALDLFAGTGSISLELLSRGCLNVIAIEKERLHYKFVTSVFNKIKTQNGKVLQGDVLRFIPRCGLSFDFIFADPPYVLPELSELPMMIFRYDLLTDGGLLVLEHGKNHDFSREPHFMEHRAYGSVNFSFFKRK